AHADRVDGQALRCCGQGLPAPETQGYAGDGIISVEAARQSYGVAVDAKTFELDEAETQRLRQG
ncbi:MAG: hypothetical protein V3T05_09565, partial [Myxococcota bacterium]